MTAKPNTASSDDDVRYIGGVPYVPLNSAKQMYTVVAFEAIVKLLNGEPVDQSTIDTYPEVKRVETLIRGTRFLEGE